MEPLSLVSRMCLERANCFCEEVRYDDTGVSSDEDERSGGNHRSPTPPQRVHDVGVGGPATNGNLGSNGCYRPRSEAIVE